MILSYVKQKTAGLANLGNTCFINTCLQILAHTFELNEIVVQSNALNQGTPESRILAEWRELLVEMWRRPPAKKKVGTSLQMDSAPPHPHPPSIGTGTGTVVPAIQMVIQPRKFLFYIQQVAKVKGQDLFTGHSQNDFSEFLHFFVDCLHEALSRPVDMIIRGDVENDTDAVALQTYKMLQKEYDVKYSDVLSVFNGVLVSEIWSVKIPTTSSPELGGIIMRPQGSLHNSLQKDLRVGKRHSTKPESFFTLDLPMNSTLLESFQTFTTGELLQGDNAWYNEATRQKETVTKRLRFWSFPPILAIVLKRFTHEGRKDATFMQYPVSGLDLAPFVCGYKRTASLYDLYGVACHMGNVNGGHYFCHVLNSKTGAWYTYDDETCTPVTPVTAKEIVTVHAYCLFYRLRAE